ncbi:hypothetical protein BH09CHL1_BH09CHL1_06330 [soil metagenome]
MTDSESENPLFPATETNRPPSLNDSELSRLADEIVELRSELKALREALDERAVRPDSADTPGFTRRCFERAMTRVRTSVSAFVTLTRFQRVQRLPDAIGRMILRGQERREWAPPRPLLCAVLALVAITAAAFAVRGMDLRHMPTGMHGDEAATGIEARRIIDSGWIGVYSGVAGGNPTGIYYLATIPISLASDPVVAVRILSAILGTAAVVVLFVLALRNAGFGTAIVASLLLSFSEWHIQFSRIGFVTGDWPTFVLIGVLCLAEGMRSRRWWWWAAAGVFISGSTYVYNGNGPLMLVVGAFVIWTLFGWRGVFVCASLGFAVRDPSLITALPLIVSGRLAFHPRFRSRTAWIEFGSYALSSLLTLRGMIDFVRAHPHDYFGRGDQISIFKSEQWRAQSGTIEHVRFLIDRYELVWNRMTFHPIPDGVDLSGVTPLIPELSLAVFLIGAIVALLRRPTPLVLLSIAIVVAMPLVPALTDLTLRRALVIAPFLALLGAIGMSELVRLAFQHGRRAGIAGVTLIAVVIAGSSYTNYNDYFNKTVASGPVRQNFPPELRQTADFLATLPPDTYVYCFSLRWVLDYDVISLIAPDVQGENRLPNWGGDGSFDIDWSKGQPVFLFIGAETAMEPEVRARYPGGTEIVGPIQGSPLNGPSYIAYLPDAP